MANGSQIANNHENGIQTCETTIDLKMRSIDLQGRRSLQPDLVLERLSVPVELPSFELQSQIVVMQAQMNAMVQALLNAGVRLSYLPGPEIPCDPKKGKQKVDENPKKRPVE